MCATAVGTDPRLRACAQVFDKNIDSTIGVPRDQITGITAKCQLRAVRREHGINTTVIPLRAAAVGTDPRQRTGTEVFNKNIPRIL